MLTDAYLSSSLAAFGAAIALLALITEPFSQAAVAIGTCERVMPGEASIPRFNNYAIAQSNANIASLTTAMQLAVYTGLYTRPTNSSESIRSTVVCPTGNCTFPVQNGASFDTLTICHTCRDVTNKLAMSNTTSGKRGAQEASEYILTGYPGNLSLATDKGPDFNGKMFTFGTSNGVYGSDRANLWPTGGWRC